MFSWQRHIGHGGGEGDDNDVSGLNDDQQKTTELDGKKKKGDEMTSIPKSTQSTIHVT